MKGLIILILKECYFYANFRDPNHIIARETFPFEAWRQVIALYAQLLWYRYLDFSLSPTIR